MAELAGYTQSFKNKNARLAVIGSGEPRHFKEFQDITSYSGQIFSDPSLKAFSLLNFSRSIAGFMSINSIFKAASAFKNGYRQGSLQGSTLQLGGAIIIDTAGSILYYFASRKAGEHPDVADLIRSIGD